ncbi:MAG: class I SAM-dependent methyltransferase [Actinomycetota bacterium]|nr:class I SAM-dependent methyltransferase [Actinomycetota bacterium]
MTPGFHVKRQSDRPLAFHVKPNQQSELVAASRRLGLHLTHDQVEALLTYAALLRTKAVPLGLIGEKDEGGILSRHVIDSLRAATAVRPSDRLAYDLGSGAGLPGIPVGLACPDLSVQLVESRLRRAGFMELAVDELGLPNAKVRLGRVEDLTDPADLCFARAFAPLPRAWEAAARLLAPGGRLVHFLGAKAALPALPGASAVELLSVPLLDSGGALAIITR